MSSSVITIELPEHLYQALQNLAAEEGAEGPAEVIAQLVQYALAHRTWQQDLKALCEQIRRNGGLPVGKTKEDVIERLRRTRREIFGAEYAHLYR